MTFKSIIDEIENNLMKILAELSISDVKFTVEPAKSGFGDVSSNVSFLLAKHLKKSPVEIADLLSGKFKNCVNTLVLKSEAHPSGYLNFFADWNKLNQLILSESYLDGFGDVDIGKNSAIVVEHTSVNPNKALHIGHIRNIIIGDCVSRILKKANYRVNVLNYIDDSGLQVADIIVGFKYFGFAEQPPSEKKFDHYCGDDVYVKTTEKYEEDPSLEEIRKNVLKELEDGNSETAKFADKITRKVLADQLETCWNLGVYYDCLNFESQIIRSGLWSKIFEKLKAMSLIEFENNGKNAGCWVIRGEDKEDDKVIVRSNGTATYIAKDIPYAAWKLGLLEDPFNYEKYEKLQPNSRDLWQTTLNKSNLVSQNFSGEKVVTVIDSRQARLQKIITSLMGKFKSVPDAYVHLGYESVTLSSDTAKTLGLDTEGKQAQMSGRKGLYVNADSVYDLLKDKTTEETQKRHPEMDKSEIEKIAHRVSVATLRYEMIKQDLDKIITFDLTKSLSLEGDTAPYIQYTHARASRILEKSNRTPTIDVDFSLLKDKSEIDLIKNIGLFNLQVRDATNNLSPKVIARYCHDLAVAFNSFYEHCKVLELGDEKLENSRLCLVNSFKLTLEKSLDLLGITAPDRM
ncbi:MAG: arginine--tRNA ligase [Nitrosopumilus sp.]|uniref:Arginine--tRNA ligase n=1 Tax=Nitrosopumilus zosterae TaxID=718286 RepID=A0A2S2KPG2_9ARCH|nr:MULTISPECIES: arginine--tRNA ligase [Nitrosopumilus]MCV0367551.1 arginine--tRNA ligase [Nitrosopumilus sp.]BDQ31174.1 arginine--tRNA ligase [Nitrosopumilus zosterae]GBH33385.1 arginine--tRNA ligase [Nitrosopumilus zosterae]